MAQQILSPAEVSNAQLQRITGINKLYQNATDLYGWVDEMPSEKVNYLGIKVPIEVSPNPSLSYGIGNNDAFATPQASDLNNYTVTYVNLNQGSLQSLAGYMNRNNSTSENVVEFQEMSDAKQFASFLNSYISRGDGTAALATISADYSDGTPTIATCNGSGDSIGTTQLVKGQYCLFYDAAGTTQRTGTVGAGAIQISSKTGTAVTFASAIPSDVVATDIIVPQLGGATDASAGLYGLPIIDDSSGTYYGASRSSIPGLASYEKTSAGTLTAGMLFETYQSIAQRGGWFTGNGSTNFDEQLWMVLNTGNLAAYQALSLNSGALVSSPQTFMHTKDRPASDLGFSSVNFTWFGAPIKQANSVRGDEIYFIGKKSLTRAVFKNVGSIVSGFPASDYLQSVDGSGNWLQGRVKFNDYWGNVYCEKPFTIGKISGITLSSPSQKSVMV